MSSATGWERPADHWLPAAEALADPDPDADVAGGVEVAARVVPLGPAVVCGLEPVHPAADIASAADAATAARNARFPRTIPTPEPSPSTKYRPYDLNHRPDPPARRGTLAPEKVLPSVPGDATPNPSWPAGAAYGWTKW
ncbi:hypothetical protein [Catenulispora sp. EB89]|uniref:hypothetical protein n=1 Tax=Catenulispora sp. EB89 TaxID=3156257 RepID=UPI003513E190